MTIRRVRDYIPGLQESSPQQREEHLSSAMADRKDAIEGNLELPTTGSRGNIFGEVVEVTFENADQDTAAEHSLGRKSTHWMVVGKNQFADFKRGDRDASDTALYLQCDTAGTTAKVLVF